MTTTSEVQPQGPIARYEQRVIDRFADFKDPRQGWRRPFTERDAAAGLGQVHTRAGPRFLGRSS